MGVYVLIFKEVRNVNTCHYISVNCLKYLNQPRTLKRFDTALNVLDGSQHVQSERLCLDPVWPVKNKTGPVRKTPERDEQQPLKVAMHGDVV
jgi:hypothetical protein